MTLSAMRRCAPHAFAVVTLTLLLTACGGGSGGGDSAPAATTFTVGASAGIGGAISPASAAVSDGATASFTVTADSGHIIDAVSGCDGSLDGSTYTTGAVTADCLVAASFTINTYAVTASAGTGGSISPASATVNYGDTASFAVTSDAGYSIASVTGCGGSLSGATYTTGAITAACAVTASFTINTYVVTATAGTNGSISPASAAANYGDTASFAVTSDAGYSIASVTGCGGSLSGTTYTTGTITAACAVTASFTVNTYAVTAAAGTGGSISPASVTVSEGATTSFTVTPDTGYSIDTVTGCGGTLGGTTYTTGAITAACAVTASFTINTYVVTATAGTNGSISPASTMVNHGATTSFIVTPDAGYGIDSASGCGGTLSGTTYATGAITAACAVSATFALPIVNITDASVVEGNSSTTSLTFTVSLSALTNGNVNVDYVTTDGTATTASGDYITASGTLTISSGTTSGIVTVSVSGDTTPEADELLTLTLSNVTANATLGAATAAGTIVSDDPFGVLNDTGITLCGDYAFGTTGSSIHNNNVDCAAAGATQTVGGTETDNGLDPVPAGQDALYGRDVTANDDNDGRAGFSFTKISASGNPLATTATSWDCVLDNATGLMWEVKTVDSGLRDKNWTYTWYSSDTDTNGGSVGTANGGTCYDSTNCDTEKYVAQVNAPVNGGICGYSDWRMPNQEELQSIADMGAWPLAIDTSYFPSTNSSWYWSSAPYAPGAGNAWIVYFYGGNDSWNYKYSTYYVRLVRAGQ